MGDNEYWLTPRQQRDLDRACEPLWSLGGVYQVGSTLRPNREHTRAPRDVDVRLLVEDETWAALDPDAWRVLSDYIGRALEAETGMQPIDFQVQQRTAANAEHKGVRSALGVLTRIRRDERASRAEVPDAEA